MSTTIAVVIAALVVIGLFVLWKLWFGGPGGVLTVTAPVRVPTIAVTCSATGARPCNGQFSGAGSVTATYPPAGPGKGNIAPVNVQLADINKQNVAGIVLTPATIKITGDGKTDFHFIDAELSNPCNAGSFVVQATVAIPPSVSVAQNQWTENSPVVNVPAIGFKINVPLPSDATFPTPGDNVDFEVKFVLDCCGAAPGAPPPPPQTYTLSTQSGVYVSNLAVTPPTFTCPPPLGGPLPPFNIKITGKWTDPQNQGHFQVIVTGPAPASLRCVLGSVSVGG